MWRFLGLGQRLTCIAKHISFFLLIWILTGILYYNFSFITLIEILNTFKSLLRKRSPFHISFEISEFAAFFYGCIVLYPPFKTWIKIQGNIYFCVFPEGLDLASVHLKHFPENGFNSYDSILVSHLVFPFHIFLRISERDLTLVRLCERGRAGQSLHQEILHLSLGGFCFSHHHRRHRHHPHA